MGTAYQGEVALDPVNSNTVYFSNSKGICLLVGMVGIHGKNNSETRMRCWLLIEIHSGFIFKVSRIAFAPSDNNRVYAGFGHLLYCAHTLEQEICQTPTYKNISFLVSNDGGATWSIIENTEISGITIADVVVHPENPEVVWVVSPWHGVYKSLNGGEIGKTYRQG